MQLRRRRQTRPSIKDLSRSARPSIRGYGNEEDATDSEGEESDWLPSGRHRLDRVVFRGSLGSFSLSSSGQEGTAGEQPAEPVSERQGEDAQGDASERGGEEQTQVALVFLRTTAAEFHLL